MTNETDFEITEHNGLFLASKVEKEEPKPTTYFRDLIEDYLPSPYTENEIQYSVEQQSVVRGSIILRPLNHPNAQIKIFNRGQYWGHREFMINGEDVGSQKEFERRLKLAAFE